MYKYLFILMTTLFLGLSSCKEDKKVTQYPDKKVHLKFSVTDGSNALSLNDQVTLSNGYDFKLALLKMYISDVTLVDANGQEFLVKDVDIISPVENDNNSTILTIPTGNYKSIRIGYGVTPEQNSSDPTSYPETHPLSNYQSMYWPMINYRFVKIEGMATQLSTSNQYLVSIHPGTDALYQVKTYTFDSTFKVDANSSSELQVSFDINDIFDGPAGIIDFAIEDANQVHMIDSLDAVIGGRFMENLSAATKLEVVPSVQ